jgi:hypothetical protein
MPLVKVIRHGFVFHEMPAAPKSQQLCDLPSSRADRDLPELAALKETELFQRNKWRETIDENAAREMIAHALKRNAPMARIAEDLGVPVWFVTKVRDEQEPTENTENEVLQVGVEDIVELSKRIEARDQAALDRASNGTELGI